MGDARKAYDTVENDDEQLTQNWSRIDDDGKDDDGNEKEATRMRHRTFIQFGTIIFSLSRSTRMKSSA